ncbi:endopeptidase La [Malassezia yamatoensis]|uniref:endopeptidase La n=1 Tax=Malassezia yamatoensis TaxID=253288 RepID=A0AAJ5YRW9_9BASI|nr:endopeptidase La [Malassezia yamatoensis]
MDSSKGAVVIPPRLPIVVLPYPQILHPGLVLSVTLPQAECLGILRTALSERKEFDSQQESRGAEAVTPKTPPSNSSQIPVLLLCVPKLSPTTGEVPQESLQGLNRWGCIARVLRLINSPATGECRLLISGLMRAKLGNLAMAAEPTGANHTIAELQAFTQDLNAPPPKEQTPSLKAMQDAARRLVEIMGRTSIPTTAASPNSVVARVPMLPPALLKRLVMLLRDVDQMPTGMLTDLLVGALGGACIWEDRLHQLSIVDVDQRVTFTTEMLQRGVERMETLRDMLLSIPYALHDQHRTALSRAQLEMIATEIARINPQVISSIRIFQGNDTQAKKSDERAVIRRPTNKDRMPSVTRRIMGADRLPGHRPSSNALADDSDDDEGDEVAALDARLQSVPLSDEARKACQQELRRLKRMPAQSMERGMLLNYLETMADLPWERTSAQLDASELQRLVPKSAAGELLDEPLIPRARKILEADHYGLDKIKKRILEYLAVLDLKQVQAREQMLATQHENPETMEAEQVEEAMSSDPAMPLSKSSHDATKDGNVDLNKISVQYKGPILLLVGPPGTGKTSIARSLAAALHRPFTRLSLGGVRDEAEIRGHRRTYVGALPGSIVGALRRAKTSDCVMLLDEVDKLSSGNAMHGDPTAALLEVLDPEQNSGFKDHYINVPIDLSRVLFIATANTLDTIPEPLLDRTDVVSVAGYTHDEKVAIAKRHILPKQIQAQGLQPSQVQISDEVLLAIATWYTREAGVRTMERRIGDVIRAKAVEYAEHRSLGGVSSNQPYQSVVKVEDLAKILGHHTYEPEVADAEGIPGVATGLAYQGSGNGGILHIETAFMPPGDAKLRLTGSLGDVIRESAELAFSWVKSHAFALGITADRASEFPKNDVHLHLPAGATPKDGPSAGVAMTCALVSLYLRVPLDPNLAMTGEITLRGHVTPVGGIKEKVLGAHRAGIRKVVLPFRNRKEYEQDLPVKVRNDLQVVFVRTIHEALAAVFGMSLEAQIDELRGGTEGRRRLQELDWHGRL